MGKFRYLTVLIITLLISCVKPYDFDQIGYEKVLVIDGLVTDQVGNSFVSITYTYPLDTTLNEFVNGATVWVEDQNGGRIEFILETSGKYKPAATVKGTEGETYQLFVQMPDGPLYSSTAETMLPAVPIDSIYSKYAFLPSEAGDKNVGGIQFFIDAHDATGRAKFYRYQWEEGYKIITPYPAAYEVLEDSSIIAMVPSIGICYLEFESNKLIFGGSLGPENRIAEFPVRFVSQEWQHLRTRYSILVRQFTITESAYLFYKRVEKSNESGGSLFDRQNGSIFGNITNTGNGEQVLGFFEVSGVSEKRRFFSHGQLDKRLPNIPYPNYCSTQDIINTTPDSALYYIERTDGNIYQYAFTPPSVSIHLRGCTDCSYYASVTPPDYWEN